MRDIELLVDCKATIGEAPTWVAHREELFWIDVKAPALHRREACGATRRWRFDADVGAFALVDGIEAAVVALRTGIHRLDFATGRTTLLAPAPFDTALFRFNEGICDPRGRFWVGVMLDPLSAAEPDAGRKSALRRFTLDDGLVATEDRAELHNGFAWNADFTAFYWSHSKARRVFRADYDLEGARIGDAMPYVDIDIGIGGDERVPDGAAMDAEGCYWCAIHGGGALHRYDPSGALVREVALPVSQPTMCAFVGDDLDEMVVTSARDKLTPRQLAKEPHAGGIFRLRPGVRGLPRPCIVH